MGTVRDPIVNNTTTGEMEVLQSGDYLNDGVSFLTLLNGTGGSLVQGTPVIAANAGAEVAKADKDTDALSKVIGLVRDTSIANSASGKIQLLNGTVMTFDSTTEVDAVAGTTGGFAMGTRYYLSGTAGIITATVPTTGYHVLIGVGISSTKLKLASGWGNRFKIT